MPHLPIMFFYKQTIFFPLVAMASLKRPRVAWIQVEIDLLKPRSDQIWIGLGEADGYWQKIEYESFLDYCQNCWHVGHFKLCVMFNIQNPNPCPRLCLQLVNCQLIFLLHL